MIDISKSRYWDEGVQLVDGCTPCSPGCTHCWSAAMTSRFYNPESKLLHIDKDLKWYFSGKIVTHPDRLKRFNTRKSKVFAIWNDLFHEDVQDKFIGKTFSAMLGYPNNQFLILTKRPQRMANLLGKFYTEVDEKSLRKAINIWHGLTVCNQQEADEKIPIFLQVPGKKFLSIEPMLGPIDIVSYLPATLPALDRAISGPRGECLDTVILGGETGPGARPMHPDWVRSVRDQCAAAGVPFFFKQWGEWLPFDQREAGQLRNSVSCKNNGWAWKIGRNKSGRFLDGRTHDALPWVNK